MKRYFVGLVGMAALLGGCAQFSKQDDNSAAATVLKGSVSTFAAHAYFRWFNQLAVNENVNV